MPEQLTIAEQYLAASPDRDSPTEYRIHASFPDHCCGIACADRCKPTDRWEAMLLLRGTTGAGGLEYAVGLQFCKDCKNSVSATEFLTNTEFVDTLKQLLFERMTLPMDAKRTVLKWRYLGRNDNPNRRT